MADDVTLPGTGAVIATDEVSSRQYQLIKLAHGADGSATLVSTASGLPVNQVSNSYGGTGITITRAADTAAYSINDVVGGVITLSSIGPSGGFINISQMVLKMNVATIASGLPDFRLYFYDSSPASAYADNAAWDLPSGDRSAYLDFIDLGTPADFGSTWVGQVENVLKKFKLASGQTSLYAYLVTLAAFTPSSNSETYTLVPHAEAV